MRSHISLLALLSLVVIIGACAPAAEEPEPSTEATTEADVEAIDELRAEYASAINSSDVDGLSAVWTSDGVFMPPNEPSVTGKEAVQSLWQKRFDQNTYGLTFASDGVVVSGDWAFDRGIATGTVTPKAGDQPVYFDNKYIAVYQRQPDGSWKYQYVIYNSNNPPGGEEAARPS